MFHEPQLKDTVRPLKLVVHLQKYEGLRKV